MYARINNAIEVELIMYMSSIRAKQLVLFCLYDYKFLKYRQV